MRKSPNWFAATCGVAYILCFLFLPVYSCVFFPLKGLLLMRVAPIVVLMIVCGLAMAVSGLLLERNISIVVGGVCAVITLIFGLLGSSVLPLRVLDQMTGISIGQYVPISMGVGSLLCMLLCVGYCVLEVLLGESSRASKTAPQSVIWDDGDGSGNFDF